LVTAENQQLLTAPVGKAKIVIDGKLVDVDLVQAPEDLRRSDPAARTDTQVKALQSLAKDMVAAVQAVVGRGATLPITITNTSNGATLSGLVTDPVTGKPMAVPVEDVLLVVNDKLALMVGGADGANNPANIAFDGVIEFGQGGYVAVLAYGLTPGKTGEVVIMSTPKLLKSLKVAADGKLAAQAQVPKDIAPGGHTVVVTVGDQAASLGFRVLSPKKVAATSKDARTLPATGSDSSMLPLVALVLAAGGVAVLAATRRRREL
jgi:LPXTG-motif cell wall-anchored protein